jgi:recombination protein RecT
MEQKALTTKEDPVYQLLASQKNVVASVIPKHLTPERFLRVAYQIINKSPKLRGCTPLSLINGIVEGSMLGLEFGRTCHLIPFGKEAVFDPDYKGLIELGYRSGKIKLWRLKPVYSNDYFEYDEGLNRLQHTWKLSDERGELVGAYSHVILTTDIEDYYVIGKEIAMNAKARSAAGKSKDSPWNNENEWQMWVKTAGRLHSKTLPSSPELQRAAYLSDMADSGLKQNISHITPEIIVDAEPEKKEEKPKPDQKVDIAAKVAAAKKKTNAETDPWDRANWINIRTAGFETFVQENIDTFESQPRSIRVEVKMKWKHFYDPKPFPGDETTDVGPKDEPEAPEQASEPDTDGPADAEAQERKKVINLIKEYEPRIQFQAKVKEDISIRGSVWPPSLEGCNRLLERCAEILQTS